ncbi:hypothetical protein H0H92_015960 [Tricholoma furcatifolium]|nr:hypothetical protein H0H92_015960 [Tricholoma furcatifolium]
MTSSSSTFLHPASSPFILRSGRWEISGDDTLIAAWCGSSLRFSHTGQSLSIKAGALTERKDRFNGGTPMIACVISYAGSTEEQTMLYDLKPLQTVQLFTAQSDDEAKAYRTVELTLIDWASILEIETFITAAGDTIFDPPHDPKTIHARFVGDSISCGYSDGSKPVPRGCLDAFPFIARDALRKEGVAMNIDMVAFPGASLTDPTQEEEGTNDDARDVDPTRFRISLCTLLSMIQVYNCISLKHIVLLYPFPDFRDHNRGGTEDSLASHVPSFVVSLQNLFPYVNISAYNIAQELKEEHTMDGLHPTVEGQAILGAAWLDVARKIVKPILA